MTANARVLQSWGVASSRQPSGCTVGGSRHSYSSAQSQQHQDSEHQDFDHRYDIALGPSVVRWDIINQKRLLQFQAHRDIITGLSKSPDGHLIVTASYSGEVKLWTSEWVCLTEDTAPIASQHYMAWSWDSQKLVLVGNGLNSSLLVYEVTRVVDGKPRLKLSWMLQASSTSEPATRIAKGEESKEEAARENVQYFIAYCMAEFNPNGNIFAVKELPYETVIIQLVSPDGSVSKSIDLMQALNPPEEYSKRPVQTLFLSTYRDGVYAVGLIGGTVVIVDADQLHIRMSFKAGTSFRTCLWDGDLLLLPCDPGKIMWWNTAGEKVEELFTGVRDLVSHISLSLSGNGLWICGSNMSFFDLDRNSEGRVTSITPCMGVHAHSITSVGVDFSPSGQYVGSGDLLGNIWVTEKDRYHPIYTCSVDGSIRCLTWLSEAEVLVGTLTGDIYHWSITESKPKAVVPQLEGGVICIHGNHQRNVLAVGTTTGDLLTYCLQSGVGGGDLALLSKMKAHTPHSGPQDKRFGQLGKQAEVWNLCWSPDDSQLATCSEDQTVKVWSVVHNWERVTTLTGHVLAVTSVDWTQCGDISLLASCSDDKTVRLYNGNSYCLLDIVNTEDICGWHTLTYLTFFLIERTPMLLCTTQNGHVVVWQVNTSAATSAQEHLAGPGIEALVEARTEAEGSVGTGAEIGGGARTEERGGAGALQHWLLRCWKGKLHLGSIEGLAWQDKQDGGSLVTVGGDCIVNLFKICIE